MYVLIRCSHPHAMRREGRKIWTLMKVVHGIFRIMVCIRGNYYLYERYAQLISVALCIKYTAAHPHA